MIDLDFLQSWTGRRETAVDRIDLYRVRQLAASFDLDDGCFREGDALPPLWHWLFATPVEPLAEAGDDGHTARGGFLPPIPLPRRMWAGSRVRWETQLPIGHAIERHSRVLGVKPKEGKTGPLVFVSVEHQWHCAGRVALVEEQDIVYRDLPETAAPGPALPTPEAPKTAAPGPALPALEASKTAAPGPAASHSGKVWTSNLEDAARPGSVPGGADAVECTVCPNEVLLFRYSALTFNSHRIHYDRRHCLEAEKYPGLVVHGPLLATMMVSLAWYQAKRKFPARLAFRAMAPVFDGEVIRIRAIRADGLHPGSALEPFASDRSTDCSVVRSDGSVAMTAQLVW